MFATINGVKLFFDIDGKQYVPDANDESRFTQKPVCFVLHGGPGCDHSSYVPCIESLADVMQLVYIDFRGCGRSDAADTATYTMAHNIEDIEALRNYLGIEKIVIFGHSYGGMTALGYALKYGKNLDALIVLCTAASYRFIEKAKETLAQIGTSEQIAAAKKYLWNGDFPDNKTYSAFFRDFASLYAVKPRNAEAFENALLREIVSFQALNMGFRTDLSTFDFTKQLHTIRCPALVIGAEKDWITASEFSEEIAAALPNCTKIIFPDCGHAVFNDRPADVLRAITEFAKKL
ncbi:MAG: alpha/beta fold hydrolase [Treponemataceae bacterium]|nr:MAG: alpha/beta fold hydrolase [Treponemataceae bacterium]